MYKLTEKYKYHFKNKEFVATAVLSLIFLAGSLAINYFAGIYATVHESSSVTDLVLSNIRVYDVDGIFTYGSMIFWLFIVYLLLSEPRRIPFTLKSIAIFVLVRSIFITLTHIGPFPTQTPIDSNLIGKFTFGGDLFFSGHTGLPFLMALLFWENKYLRVLFTVAALLFGVVVLLAHLHYSIDVLSAFFITYTIFHISERIFKKDRLLFNP